MNATQRQRLVQAVQTNCHIADARHAADMPLCTYLLQMREFFRWERALPFGAMLPRDEVGTWIAQRETLWATLEDQDFQPLPALGDAAALDPFDVRGVNDALGAQQLVYGAGVVGAARPVFFLAERHAHARREGIEVMTAGREWARGLLSPPAALGRIGIEPAIVLRRESLARWCWEKYEAYTLRRAPGTAMHSVVQAYALDDDFEGALPRLLDEQTETMLLHELGEARAGQTLGPDWAELRMALPTRRADLHARAVRDHMADLAITLPTLLERDAKASIHFWFAGLDGVREALFPALKTGYAAWRSGDDGAALQVLITRGRLHFEQLARQLLALHAQRGAQAADTGNAIEECLTAPAAVCPA
jgi:hypothetical protein